MSNSKILLDDFCKSCFFFGITNFQFTVHGLSVGFRFDPESLLFSEPCICEVGWKGEMCDYRPAEKVYF